MELLWEILGIIVYILIYILFDSIPSYSTHKKSKTEYDKERTASQEKKVYMDRSLIKILTVLMTILAVFGTLLIIFPKLLEGLDLDYTAKLVVVWGPVAFALIVYAIFFIKFKYDEEKFEYTNAFGFTRSFRYEDVVKVIVTKCFVKIITTNKKIGFGIGLCGAKSFVVHLKKRAIETGFEIVES